MEHITARNELGNNSSFCLRLKVPDCRDRKKIKQKKAKRDGEDNLQIFDLSLLIDLTPKTEQILVLLETSSASEMKNTVQRGINRIKETECKFEWV